MKTSVTSPAHAPFSFWRYGSEVLAIENTAGTLLHIEGSFVLSYCLGKRDIAPPE